MRIRTEGAEVVSLLNLGWYFDQGYLINIEWRGRSIKGLDFNISGMKPALHDLEGLYDPSLDHQIHQTCGICFWQRVRSSLRCQSEFIGFSAVKPIRGLIILGDDAH